jgi:UDP-glucose 4-epimerase
VTRALVTGGAGFIGSHIVRGLLDRGDHVVVLDNLSTGHRSNLKDLEVEFIEGDIRDVDVVVQAMRAVDVVHHHAAYVSSPASLEEPVECYEINLNGSVNILNAARESGVRRVVMASSAAVYGEAEGPVREEDGANPSTPYAASKLAMEEAATLYTHTFKLPTTCLRYFNVYGPRQSLVSTYAAAIPIFITAMLGKKPPTIYGDGGQSRDFVYVDDVVRANLLASEAEGLEGGVFNIASGDSISITTLVKILERLIPEAPEPIQAPPREGDIYASLANISHAERALGYRPMIDLEDGLKHTVQWFDSERQPRSS